MGWELVGRKSWRPIGVALFISVLLVALAPIASAQSGANVLISQGNASYDYSPSGPLLWTESNFAYIYDTRGHITGWSGDPIPSFNGFNVSLCDTAPSAQDGSGILRLTKLTPTQPGISQSLSGLTASLTAADNSLEIGIDPNNTNSNPFALADASGGTYSFLLNPAQGQLTPGRMYIIIITPPTGSPFGERRVQIQIGATHNGRFEYTATALDGLPIYAHSSTTATTVHVNSWLTSYGWGIIGLDLSVYLARRLQITLTTDQAAVEPGDVDLFRATVTNNSAAPIRKIAIQGLLPNGFRLVSGSVKAASSKNLLPVKITGTGASPIFDFGSLVVDSLQTITLVYAAQVTVDAADGNARSGASVNAEAFATVSGIENVEEESDGPIYCSVLVEPGILNDNGIIVGRVFVDTNGDGRQDGKEIGVPGAVIVFDTGDQITTDSNGLFTISDLPSGYHTATLDLTSIPNYQICASNQFIADQGASRIIRLDSGTMAQLSFALKPVEKR